MRYGKLDPKNKFAGVRPKTKVMERDRHGDEIRKMSRSRDARIRRGDDAITESLAGIDRPEEEYDEKKGFAEDFEDLHED